MAISVEASGTQTSSVDIEHTLSTKTDPKVYILSVDLSAMALGDIVELRLKTKVLTGGTSRVAYLATYAHVQGQPNVYSVPVPISWEIIATLKQTAGSSRNYPWELLSQ